MKKIILSTLCLGIITQANAVTSKQVFPGKEDWIMLNGVNVRKGTINATGINIMTLDKLLAQNSSEEEVKQIIADQKSLSQGLHATEYFDMQPLPIFLKNPARQGRIMIAVLAIQAVPNLLTKDIRNRLIELKQSVHPLLQQEIDLVL